MQWTNEERRTKRSKTNDQTLSRRPEGGGIGSGHARLGSARSSSSVVRYTCTETLFPSLIEL